MIGGIRRAIRWVDRHFGPRGIVLLYHRIAEPPSDPQMLCVRPRHFAEHLAVLKACGQPLPLRQLVQELRDGRLTDRSLAVTFDDGYADTLAQGAPLLARYEIHATVFVTAGSLGESREYWWDELERLLLLPGRLPGTLRLTAQEKTYQWELGTARDYTEQAWRRDRQWSVLMPAEPTTRHAIYRTLCKILRPLPEGERCACLKVLQEWAGVGPIGREDHRALSVEELVRLGREGHIEVGAHGMTHAMLSAIPREDQWREIEEGQHRLKDLLGRPVTSFAYPYGGAEDYTEETVRLVRAARFDCACANVPEPVRRRSDRFRIPRFVVRDWNGQEFRARVEEWFRG